MHTYLFFYIGVSVQYCYLQMISKSSFNSSLVSIRFKGVHVKPILLWFTILYALF